ncbi:MAG: O-antigen ligase family protein [Eubacterium sp.]
MSGIGLVQFVLQFFDISFFVTLYTDMHRCNGFSFEPSYYSTYLLMGWTICMYLLEKSNNTIISTRKLVIFTTIITLALVTSTSRMGWMMMGVYIVFRAIIILFTRMNSKLSVWECLILLVAAVGIVFVAWGLYSALSGNTKILKYLNGLGIAGMSSHSISFRLRSQIETFEVFKNSPVIGCSLGGVDPEICYNRNIKYNNRLNGISGNIFAEILAGTGIVGFLFFVRFLYVITCQKYKKVKNSISKHKKEILVAVIFALIMEITILQMNQNILRQPLWIHISIVCSLYYLAEKQKAQ